MVSQSTKEILRKTNYDEIIGLPPLLYVEEDDIADKRKKLILNTMNILEITPGFPGQFTSEESSGLRLYTFDESKGREVYNKLVKKCLPNTKDIDTIKVAFLNENAFSESWSNDFGESILEEAMNFGIPTVRELRLLYGTSTLSEALRKFTNFMTPENAKTPSSVPEQMWEFLNRLGTTMTGYLSTGVQAAEEFVSGLGGAGAPLRQILYGSNIDFPQIWRGSSFSPSYSITVRLFNPFNLGIFQESLSLTQEQQEKYIIEPLVKLLVLVVPISDSNSTFFSPLICKVRCPGLFSIKMGYVSAIDVIKGGDTNDVSYFQKPGTVDVKITFNDLYTSMVQELEDSEEIYDKNRPTLTDYVNTLRGYTIPPSIYYDEYNIVAKTSNTPDLITYEVPPIMQDYEELSRVKQIPKSDLPDKISNEIPSDQNAIDYYSNKEFDESAFFTSMPTAQEQLEKELQQLAEEQEFFDRITLMKDQGEIDPDMADTILEVTQKSIDAHNLRIGLLEGYIEIGGTGAFNLWNITNESIQEILPLRRNTATYMKLDSLKQEYVRIQKLLEEAKSEINNIREQKNEILPTDARKLLDLERREAELKKQLVLYNNEINSLLKRIKELSKDTLEDVYKGSDVRINRSYF